MKTIRLSLKTKMAERTGMEEMGQKNWNGRDGKKITGFTLLNYRCFYGENSSSVDMSSILIGSYLFYF